MELLKTLNQNKGSVIAGLIGLVFVIFHLAFYNVLEFHRDELLYLSPGQHPVF